MRGAQPIVPPSSPGRCCLRLLRRLLRRLLLLLLERKDLGQRLGSGDVGDRAPRALLPVVPGGLPPAVRHDAVLLAEESQEDLEVLTTAGPSMWTIHRHYADNDVSTYKDVVRPEFELLLQDLETGAVEGILVYDLDRLARRPKDLERVIDIYDTAAKSGRKLFFATVHDKIDLSSPDGLTLARV